MELLELFKGEELNILGKEIYITGIYIKGLDIIRNIKPVKAVIKLNSNTPNVHNYFKFVIKEYKQGNKTIMNVNTLNSLFTFKAENAFRDTDVISYVRTKPYNSTYTLSFFNTLEEAEIFYNLELENLKKVLERNSHELQNKYLESLKILNK